MNNLHKVLIALTLIIGGTPGVAHSMFSGGSMYPKWWYNQRINEAIKECKRQTEDQSGWREDNVTRCLIDFSQQLERFCLRKATARCLNEESDEQFEYHQLHVPCDTVFDTPFKIDAKTREAQGKCESNPEVASCVYTQMEADRRALNEVLADIAAENEQFEKEHPVQSRIIKAKRRIFG